MKNLIVILFILFALSSRGQTVIEMMHPQDADIILLRTDDSTKADIIVYLTDKKDEYGQWNCSWKIKKWGFSNFSIFIASDTAQLILNNQDFIDEENRQDSTIIIKPQGMVYFTTNPNLKGYKDPDFKLPGVMRVIRKSEQIENSKKE
jgi:hypothetical protein